MTVTILAVTFLIILLAVVAFGFKAIIRQGKSPEELNKERCSICRAQLDRSELIERTVGDYRILYFCSQCIESLHHEKTTRG
jgi:hypothetical protein